jgi:hypothetical protein
MFDVLLMHIKEFLTLIIKQETAELLSPEIVKTLGKIKELSN